MLYDALNNPNYKPSFANNEDERIIDWFDKRRNNKTNPKDYSNFSILTDDEISQIKANWEEKKAEIQQEQPTVSEPAPQEVKAEVQQDNELSDNEKKALDMLMTMNPNLDISKLTTAQLKEKINRAMALFGESVESIYESAMKHPWLNKLMGQRLVEDDSPADFASGSPISSDMDSAATSTDTSTTTDTSSTPDIDLGGGATPATPNSFGDVDISVNGYDPEGEGEEGNIPAPNAPEFDIIDVLANTEDPTDVKVKLKNAETGEVEIKDISEI